MTEPCLDLVQFKAWFNAWKNWQINDTQLDNWISPRLDAIHAALIADLDARTRTLMLDEQLATKETDDG